jgi:hypothetical protein
MKTFKNIVTEAKRDEITKSMLRSADGQLVNNVRNRYYAIADNMQEFVFALNTLNGETGEFSFDLGQAKKMQKLFDKMQLGKFL